MRASVVHILVALLIAVFAIGSAPPAQADCTECQDCSVEAPARSEAPCPQEGLACHVAQTCASQVQKAPAQIGVHPIGDADVVAFADESIVADKSAYITPESAPPRL